MNLLFIGGAPGIIKLSVVDEAVFDVIGRDSFVFNGAPAPHAVDSAELQVTGLLQSSTGMESR